MYCATQRGEVVRIPDLLALGLPADADLHAYANLDYTGEVRLDYAASQPALRLAAVDITSQCTVKGAPTKALPTRRCTPTVPLDE